MSPSKLSAVIDESPTGVAPCLRGKTIAVLDKSFPGHLSFGVEAEVQTDLDRHNYPTDQCERQRDARNGWKAEMVAKGMAPEEIKNAEELIRIIVGTR